MVNMVNIIIAVIMIVAAFVGIMIAGNNKEKYKEELDPIKCVVLVVSLYEGLLLSVIVITTIKIVEALICIFLSVVATIVVFKAYHKLNHADRPMVIATGVIYIMTAVAAIISLF